MDVCIFCYLYCWVDEVTLYVCLSVPLGCQYFLIPPIVGLMKSPCMSVCLSHCDVYFLIPPIVELMKLPLYVCLSVPLGCQYFLIPSIVELMESPCMSVCHSLCLWQLYWQPDDRLHFPIIRGLCNFGVGKWIILHSPFGK